MILGGRVGDAIFHLTSIVKTYEEAFSASAIKFVLKINFGGEVDPQCQEVDFSLVLMSLYKLFLELVLTYSDWNDV